MTMRFLFIVFTQIHITTQIEHPFSFISAFKEATLCIVTQTRKLD